MQIKAVTKSGKISRALFDAAQCTLFGVEHIVTFAAGSDAADAVVLAEAQRARVPVDAGGEPTAAWRPRGRIA